MRRKYTIIITVCAAAAFTSACSSTSPQSGKTEEHEVKEELMMDWDVEPDHQKHIATSPIYKAYPMSRYSDPSNPRIMHEAHTIYRKEQNAKWRYDTPPERQIITGNRITGAPLQRKPQMLPEDLKREVITQRKLSRKLLNAYKKTSDRSSEVAFTGAMMTAEISKLRRAYEEQKEKVKRMERELQKNKSQNSKE